MKNKVIALSMIAVMAFGVCRVTPVSEAKVKKPALSKTSLTVKMYETKKVTIKNVKKTQVKSLTVKTADKMIATAKKKNNTTLAIKGVDPYEKTNVTVTLKLKKKIAGKKKYSFKIKVKVIPDRKLAAEGEKGAAPDYTTEAGWLHIPENTDKPVDTFYLFPTTYYGDYEGAPEISPLDDANYNEEAKEVYESQATAFEDSTNVYAPFYRQTSMAVLATNETDDLMYYQRHEQKKDVFDALDYYFKNYNEGRPFVLVGHSQGAMMVNVIVEDYMKRHPDLYKRMIAAYAIGYSVTKQNLKDYPHMKFAEGADDTGVIISWNTEGVGNLGQRNKVVRDGAISINPINWKRDETYAPESDNLGSLVQDPTTGKYEIKMNMADARLDLERGVVITKTKFPTVPLTEVFGPESYHEKEIEMFYNNIKKNVEDRIHAYEITVSDRKVIKEEEFGGVYIDLTIDEFNKLGFEYGDSVDITFSNGYKLEDLPYYNGFYTKAGGELLVGYPGYPWIEAAVNLGESMWNKAGLKDGDTAEIKLKKKGAYKDVQEARNIVYSDERSEYPSDEVFANFRCVEVGDIKKGVLYRSASPCDNQHNRAGYSDKLIKDVGIKTILNLSDTEEKIQGYKEKDDFESHYFWSLYQSGGVILSPIAPFYRNDKESRMIGESITKMANSEPPYLVHCTEGKDRTGFICIVLEALCGATLEEMRDDYMVSYENYYGITQENDPKKYNTLEEVFEDLIEIMIGDAGVDPETADLSQYASDYLKFCGVSDDTISKLKERLTK